MRRSSASPPWMSWVAIAMSAAVTVSTGSAIITRTRMLRPRARSASRQAIRSDGRHPENGRLTG